MTFSGINAKYLGGSDDLLSFMCTQLQVSTELHLVEEMRGKILSPFGHFSVIVARALEMEKVEIQIQTLVCIGVQGLNISVKIGVLLTKNIAKKEKPSQLDRGKRIRVGQRETISPLG